MSHLSREDLKRIGFASVGTDVRISTLASFHGPERIELGDNVRIDDFCVLSAGKGGITIGRHVHIGVFSSIIGAGRVVIGDFTDISSRVSIYSSNEDYSGATVTTPTVPEEFGGVALRGVIHGDVSIGRHAIVACGTVVLPSVTIGDGVAIGALSLVKTDCAEFGIYAGVPVRLMKKRRKDLLELERRWTASLGGK